MGSSSLYSVRAKPLPRYKVDLQNCIFLALTFYEYAITFSQEIATVWRRRLTATSILLITTRWTLVLNAALSFAVSPKEVSVRYRWILVYSRLTFAQPGVRF